MSVTVQSSGKKHLFASFGEFQRRKDEFIPVGKKFNMFMNSVPQGGPGMITGKFDGVSITFECETMDVHAKVFDLLGVSRPTSIMEGLMTMDPRVIMAIRQRFSQSGTMT